MKRHPAVPIAASLFLAAGLAGCGDTPTGPEAVDRIEVTPSSLTLRAVDETHRFAARPVSSSGETVRQVSLVWSTSDASVAEVDSTGTVTATGSGNTEVQVRAVGTRITGSAVLSVDQDVSSVTVTPDSAMLTALGTRRDFGADVRDPNGNPVTDASPDWTSTRPAVATVDASGSAVSREEGTTEILAVVSGVADTALLTVEQRVSAVRVEPDSVALGRGDTLVVAAEPIDRAGTVVPQVQLSWSSSDSSVVEIGDVTDGTAEVRAVGTGAAEVAAEAPNGSRGVVPVVVGSNLRVRSLFVRPRGVLEDSTVHLGAVVTNTGSDDLSSVEWTVRRSDGTELRSGTIAELEAGASDSLPPQTGLGPFAAGSHSLTLELDPDDEIDETRESDNTASARVESYPPGYDIELRFVGTVSSSLRSIARSARDRWERALVGDLPDVSVQDSIDLDQCYQEDTGAGRRGAPVDDLLLLVRSDSIDGDGGVLAQAGPCFVRISESDPGVPPLPVVGAMLVDSADAGGSDGGTVEEIVVHEIAHVLGFGVLWNYRGGDGQGPYQLLEGAGSEDPVLKGAAAIEKFREVGGDDYDGEPVPVANQGGPGTRDSHWRESVFVNELLTGFINPRLDNPLSVVTLGAMADMFYAVDYGEADPFQITVSGSLLGDVGRGSIELRDHILRVPLLGVTPSGTVRPVSPAARE